MSKDLEKKDALTKIADAVTYIQEKCEKGIADNNTEIKNAQAALEPHLKKIELLEKTALEEKNSREKLEAAILRLGNASAEGKGAAENSEYRNAFKSYLRKRELIGNEMSEKYIKDILNSAYNGTESKDIDVMYKTLRSDIGPEGGYFIAPQKGAVVKGRYFESTPMRLLSDVMEITSNQIDFPLDDQQLGEPVWDSEVTDTPEVTTPQIGLVNILAHQQSAYVDVTQTMLDDMPDVDTWIISKIDDKFKRDENTQYVRGNGASKPKGFLSYAAWASPSTIAGVEGTYERNKIEQISSGVSGVITADALRCMQAAQFEEYQENSVWVMKRGTWGVVTELKDGVGQYLINPRLLREGAPLTLLNRPVVFGNDMQTIAADALPIAYGDFKRGYQIVDRLGMRILRNPYIQHPRVRFQAFRRTGGGVKNFQCIKLLKLAA